MRSDRSNGEKEGSAFNVNHCLVQQTEGLFGQDIGTILPFVAAGGVLVPLKAAIQIVVRERIDEEVLSANKINNLLSKHLWTFSLIPFH